MAGEHSSGTQTAVITTEHSLATITSAGAYVLHVDLSNMVNGDVVELVAKTKVTSTSTARQLFRVVYSHAQADPNVQSVPVASPHSVEFLLKQTAGTGPNFDWSVVSL